MGAIFALLLAGLAADPVPLAPSGPWQVDYAANRCALTREFGEGEDKVSLGLMPVSGDERVSIALLAGPGRLIGQGQAVLSFDGKAAEEKHRHFYYATMASAGTQAVIKWSRTRMGELAAARLLKIEAPRRTLVLEVRGIAKALATLADCEKNLLTSWGYDPSVVATPVKAINAVELLDNKDYSRRALEVNAGGETMIRVGVGADGKVSECVLLEGTGRAELDDLVCQRVLERGRFEAALDKDGKPVKAMRILVFRWQIG